MSSDLVMQRTWDEDRAEAAEATVADPPAAFHRNSPLPGLELSGEHGLMRVASTVLDVQAPRAREFIDVTAEVERFVTRTQISHGQLLVHALHTTVAIVVNEREPLLLEDACEFLERLAPVGGAYRHDDFVVRTVNMVEGERANAHAHLQQLLLAPTATLPVIRGRVALGQWQRIFWVELDHPRARQIVLQLTGIRGF